MFWIGVFLVGENVVGVFDVIVVLIDDLEFDDVGLD